jgi:hypothetical protein
LRHPKAYREWIAIVALPLADPGILSTVTAEELPLTVTTTLAGPAATW